jgi:hypothetical protein
MAALESGQGPISFSPPSKILLQTRFGAPARAARVGPNRVQGVANIPPVRKTSSVNPNAAPFKMIWLVGAAPRGLERPLPA